MAYVKIPPELRKRPVYIERQIVTDPLTDTSLCVRCQQTKAVTCFKLRFVERKNGQVPESWCKECKQTSIEEYRKTPAAMAANNARVKANLKTPAGAAKRTAYIQSYGQVPKNKVTMQRQHRRYYSQPHNQIKAALQGSARRAKEEAGTLTASEWKAILKAWSYCCAYCKRTQQAVGIQRLCLEHVKALSIGGTHDMDNVVPACKSCNSKKRDLPIDSALERLKIEASAWHALREEKLKTALSLCKTKKEQNL
jgi:5-methylcytosine-specific restriction endonuclease McrA